MEKIIKSIALIAFGILTAFIVLKSCEGPKQDIPDPIIIYKDKIVTIPKLDTIIQTNTLWEIERDTFLRRDTIVDTIIRYISDNTSKELLAEIARNHYQKNVYSDSIQIDSLGFVIIRDTLQANHIKHREIEYHLEFQPPNLRKAFLSVGASAGGNKTHFDAGVGAMFTTKNKLSIGYDYYGVSKSHMITVKKSIFNFK